VARRAEEQGQLGQLILAAHQTESRAHFIVLLHNTDVGRQDTVIGTTAGAVI
jgi:hypothetical protein